MPFDGQPHPSIDQLLSQIRANDEAREKAARKRQTNLHTKREVTPTPRFHAEQKARVEAREARREKREKHATFPLKEMAVGAARMNVSRKLQEIAAGIAEGRTEGIPSDVLTQNSDGELVLDLEKARAIPNPDIHDVHYEKLAGLKELAQILDRDLTLRGEPSLEIQEFKEKRREIKERTAHETRAYLEQQMDYTYELASDKTIHEFRSEEEREAYKELQQHVQHMVNRIFAASGISFFYPKVHITRSKELNAFVFSGDIGEGYHNYADAAKQSDEPLELPIFIHRGLLDGVESEDELAGILAHEFSHLLQPEYGRLKDSDHTRRLEFDADATAMRLMDAAGYNPRGIIDFFQRFKEGGEGFQRFLKGTHPTAKNRYVELEKLFHRSELPFVNAGDDRNEFPENVSKAFAFLRNQEVRQRDIIRFSYSGWYTDNSRRSLEQDTQDIKNAEGIETFLSSSTQHSIENVLSYHRRKRAIEQEFAHDTFGFRSLFLADLSNFAYFAANKDRLEEENPGHTFELQYNGLRVSRLFFTKDGEVENDFFDVSSEMDWESEIAHGINRSKRDNKFLLEDTRRQRSELEKQYGFAPDDSLDDLESWIDGSSEEAEAFWRLVVKERNDSEEEKDPSTMSRVERLAYLRTALESFMSDEQSRSTPFSVIDVYTDEVVEHKLVGVGEAIEKVKDAVKNKRLSSLKGRARTLGARKQKTKKD